MMVFDSATLYFAIGIVLAVIGLTLYWRFEKQSPREDQLLVVLTVGAASLGALIWPIVLGVIGIAFVSIGLGRLLRRRATDGRPARQRIERKGGQQPAQNATPPKTQSAPPLPPPFRA